MAAADGTVTEVTRSEPVPAGDARSRHHRLRSWLALVLVVAAVVAVMVSTAALWAHGTLFDTDKYVRTMGPVLTDPAVQDRLATYATDQAIAAGDLRARIAGVLPDRAAFLAGPITEQIRGLVQERVRRFLGTPQAQRLWLKANEVAHRQLVASLRDENKVLLIGENDVTLNLLPIIGQALQRVQERLPGVVSSRITLPRIDWQAPPDEARAQLSAALGRPLPPDFGSVTLLKGDQGARAKQAVALFDRLVVLIVVVTVALIVAAILVSPRRRLTVLELALGVLVGVVAGRVVVAQAQSALLADIRHEGLLPVVNALMTQVTEGLRGFFVWLIVAGAVVAVATFIALRPAWTDWIGRHVTSLFGLASGLPAAGTSRSRRLAEHRDALHAGGVGVAVLALLIAPRTWSWLLAVLLALVAYEVLIMVFVAGETAGGQTGPPES